jgi:hypothetical protein
MGVGEWRHRLAAAAHGSVGGHGDLLWRPQQRISLRQGCDSGGGCTVHRRTEADLSRPIAPTLPIRQRERTSPIQVKATNTRHWASMEPASSGTRMTRDLSHKACFVRFLPLRFEAG